jgi:hypothetical protein
MEGAVDGSKLEEILELFLQVPVEQIGRSRHRRRLRRI